MISSRKYGSLGLIALLWLAFACSQPAPAVQGEWQADGMVGFDQVQSIGDTRYLFGPNGEFEQKALGRSHEGSWEEFEENGGKFIRMNMQGREPFIWRVVELSREKLIYEEDSPMKRQFILKRIVPEKGEKPKKRTGKKAL